MMSAALRYDIFCLAEMLGDNSDARSYEFLEHVGHLRGDERDAHQEHPF